jgi:hypothetical protein
LVPLVQQDPDQFALEFRHVVWGGLAKPPSKGFADVPEVSEVEVDERDGVLILAPAGALSDPLPAGLAEGLGVLIADRPTIVDLSGIIMMSAAPVVGLAAWAVGASQQPDQCCVVCSRATGRALLRNWHITRSLAVFGSVGDALQARRFAQEGYGTGWHPDSAGRGITSIHSVARPGT